MQEHNEMEFRLQGRRPPILAANALYLLAVVGLILLQFVAVFLGLPSDGVMVHVQNLTYYAAFMLLPVIVYVARRPGMSQALRLNPLSLGAALIAAGAAFICFFLTDYVTLLWMMFIQRLGGRLIDSSVAIPTNQRELILSMIFIGLVPGISEELLFRGVVLGAWERKGPKVALCISSILFATMHGSVFGLPAHLIAAFILGYIVMTTDSLYAGMIFHTLYNCLAMLFSYLNPGGSEEVIGDLYRYIGGIPGVIQCMVQLAVFVAIELGLLFALRFCRKFSKQTGILVDPAPVGNAELILMIAGLATVASMYLIHLLTIIGVL